MKTKTKLIILLASVTLLTACGNNQKAEDSFTNNKEPQTTQTTQSTETSKSSETTETSTEQEQSEQYSQPLVGTTPALQPTFEIKYMGMGHDTYGTLIETYTVIHRPTGDKVYKALTEEQAKAFSDYMEQIAHGKEKLDNTMTQNFEFWCTNY